MTLTQWHALPGRERVRLILDWYATEKWDRYEKLAFQAARSLEKELASVQEITDVETDWGEELAVVRESHVAEIVLVVRTVLPASSCLAEIPLKFKGFGVRQMHLGDRRDAFLRTWKRLFRELAGWDDRKTIEWAKKCAEGTKGQLRTAVYHYGPIKTALPSLVDEKTKKMRGPKPRQLYDQFLNIIWHGGRPAPTDFPDTVDDYDWEQVRKAIDRLVRMYSRS